MSSVQKIVESEVKSIILEVALESHTLKEHQKLVEKREDAQSLLVKEVLLHIYGPDLDFDKIDESVWSKVKNMVAKGSTALGNLFQVGKRKWEIEADRFEIEDLLQKAGNSLPSGLMKQLAAEDPDGGVFPNGEDEALFASRLNAIQFAYGLIMSGLENGVLPHESAEAGVMAMRKFLESSLDKLSAVYKTFNEEEEVEEEIIFENSLIAAGGKGLFGLNFNKILQKAQNADLATIRDTIADLTSRIAAPGKGRDEAAQAVLDKLQGMADGLAGTAKAANVAAGGAAAKGGAAATSGAGAGIKSGVIATTKPTLPAFIATSKKYTFLQRLAAALGVSPSTALALAGAALIGGLYLKGKISSRAAAIKKTLELLKVPEATAETNVIPEPGEPTPTPSPSPEPGPDEVPSPKPGPDGEPSPEPGPDGEPSPEEPEAVVDDTLPLSSSEIGILSRLVPVTKAGDRGFTRLFNRVLSSLGVAARRPEDREMLAALRRSILPKINSLLQRSNVELAEGDETDLYMEQEETPEDRKKRNLRQRNAMRKKMGLMSALKKVGDKEPRFVRKMEQVLDSTYNSAIKSKKRVTDAINAELDARLKKAGKDEKKRKEIESLRKRQLKDIKRRQASLRQSADVLKKEIMKIVRAGVEETASEFKKEKRALPETSQINETLTRWSLLAGISNKKVL